MQVQPYLFFDGRCEEASAFYKKAIGAEVLFMMRYSDSPEPHPPGNHDAVLTDHCGGDVVAEAEVDGLVLRHEADPHEIRPELSGHFHPKLRLTLRGRYVARRCFVASGTKLILPAFGALTGGMDAHDPVILRAVGRSAQALVPVENKLLRFPLAA